MKMKNKKGSELSLNVIVIAAIALIVLVVSIMVFTGLIGQSVNDTNTAMGITKNDFDTDGIKDFVDMCPCDFGVKEYGGCLSLEKMNAEGKDRDCLSK